MSTQVPNKIRKVALALLGALAIIVALRVVMPGGPKGDARPALQREWKRVEVLGLSFETPGRFIAISIPVPPELRTSVARIENFGRNVGQTEMRVSRIHYLPGVRLGLQAAAQGAIEGMRVNPAITKLAETHTPATVSTIPAIRTSATFDVQGRPAHGEFLTVIRGDTVWQVHVLGPADGVTPELGRRLMASTRMATP